MNNSIKNKNIKDLKSEILDWNLIQAEMKKKLGIDIYESWLKKINFHEEFNNYLILTVPTRFIRDWITSRYLDQILQIVKEQKKHIIRIELKIVEKQSNSNQNHQNFRPPERVPRFSGTGNPILRVPGPKKAKCDQFRGVVKL